jgi:hypothetical protein
MRGGRISLKKPAKTREELESAIRLEMEDICETPTDLAISVVPHEDEPDRQISRIRLSDKTSRLRFRVQRRLQFLNTLRS